MAKSVNPTNPTAAQVRAALGKPSTRGVLSKADIAAYNKGKRGNKRYVPGAGVRQAAERQAERAALREAGLLGEKARGPLSKAAKEFLAQRKG
jgi:hypothetical protein